MKQIVSKSQFKPQVLEYLRLVEKTKKPLIIPHAGKPVVQIIPFMENLKEKLKALQGSIIFYKNPTEPVGLKDWETLK